MMESCYMIIECFTCLSVIRLHFKLPYSCFSKGPVTSSADFEERTGIEPVCEEEASLMELGYKCKIMGEIEVINSVLGCKTLKLYRTPRYCETFTLNSIAFIGGGVPP